MKRLKSYIQEAFAATKVRFAALLAKLPRVEILAISCTAAILLFANTDINKEFITRSQHPSQFELRSFLGKDPQIDSRIKMYGIGDKSVSRMGKTDVSLVMWGKIIKGLSEAGAEYIFLDKLFGTPEKDSAAIEEFYNLLSDVQATVIVGSFIESKRLKYKYQLQLDNLGALEERNVLKTNPEKSLWIPYGTTEALQDAFDRHGHINYDDDNKMRPLYPIGPRTYLPAAAFHIVEDKKVSNGQLYLDGRRLPTDEQGKVLINIAAAETYWDKQIRFSSLYFRARDDVKIPLKPHQKIVVIHGGIYTGGTDFVETAMGQMPGAFTHIALMNSILNKDWIRVMPFQDVVLLLFCIFGYLIARRMRPKLFFAFVLGVPTMTVMIGLASFVWLGIDMPWLNSSIAYLTVTGVVFLERMRETEIKSLLLQRDLDLGKSAQELFMPDAMKGKMGSYKFSIVFKPWGPLSGDWVQSYHSDEVTAIAIGDVVGKGPSAALNTSVIATIWSEHCEKWSQTHEVDIVSFAENLNHVINRLFRGKQFTTFTCVVAREDSLALFNIGAPPWLKMGLGTGCKSVRIKSNNPLGIIPNKAIYESKVITLEKGETLIAYTDGVMDGTGSRRSLNRTFKKREDALSHDQCSRLIFEAGIEERLQDDYTLLVISQDDEQPKATPKAA